MVRLLMIADDFTGALDSGVQFALCGAATCVVTTAASFRDYIDAYEVLVIDAETRHLSVAEAYKIVYEIVAQSVSLGVEYIFKKTDSALRGNIGAELTAVLNASGMRQLPFLPAFPKMNRITCGGVQYIDGIPVAESVFGSDPFEPVKESRIDRLIHKQSDIPVICYPAKHTEDHEETGIVVYDAANDEDLYFTVQVLASQGKLFAMAGCAGFSSVLSQFLKFSRKDYLQPPLLDPRFLVICGSVNPITVAQLNYAEQNGFLRIRLTPKQKSAPNYWDTPEGRYDLQEIEQKLSCASQFIIDVNPPSFPQSPDTKSVRPDTDINELRKAVSNSIGELVDRLMRSNIPQTLLIIGGDTLRCCMDHMGIHKIEPLRELAVGVVLSRFTYCGRSRHVITKSGGFGDEALLLKISKLLLASESSSNRQKSSAGKADILHYGI